MAGLDFKAPMEKEKEDDVAIAHNTRIGLILFFVYLAFYSSFMGLSAFYPDFMGTPFLGGVNLSIVYGFMLIILALVLALLYMKLCYTARKGGAK